MAAYLKLDYPEVSMTARIGAIDVSVRRADTAFQEQVFFADPDFFRMLPFPLFAGNLASALDSPDGVVITRTIARKYFGSEDPLGQPLEMHVPYGVDASSTRARDH